MPERKTIYLFDWGNTLMKDDPAMTGPMYLWKTVALCEHAYETLETLSGNHKLYLATNAKDSDEGDIWKALDRVGIGRFITGIFCYRRLGVLKPSSEFFQAVIRQLGCRPDQILMVGDDPVNDAAWAVEYGGRAVLYDPDGRHRDKGFDTIRDLRELCKG